MKPQLSGATKGMSSYNINKNLGVEFQVRASCIDIYSSSVPRAEQFLTHGIGIGFFPCADYDVTIIFTSDYL